MKKLTCLFLIFSVCILANSVSLASTSFSDVKGTKYEDAVKNLVDIGLVNGYATDNTYRPNNAVTRAEMAKLMVVALGEEGKLSTAEKEKNVFTDIESEHWAYGYVNLAKNLKIINGYPDGRFAPEDTVTYSEAVTMIVRALGYETDVERSSEAWPNNYISYAKKLSLFDKVGTFSDNKGAQRGDVALLLWNMLRTGVCEAKSQTTNGGIVYGQGQTMLNKYKNYIYLKDATITSVNFSDDFSEAKVTIKGSETLTVTMDSDDVLEFYGRELELLYDEGKKEFLSIDITDDYSKEEGNITKITSKEIYLVDEDGYNLPDKNNILLYEAEDIDSAIEATLIMDGSTVKYIIVSGARNVSIGLVYESDIIVDKMDGVKINKLGSSSNSSYALIDESDMPEEGSVILYYLNPDNELGIIEEINVDDASEISSLTSSKIKVGKTTYEYSSNTFEVVAVTASSVKTLSFTKIDEEADLVYVYQYAGKTYLIVFVDSIISESDKNDLLDELDDYIARAEDVYEEDYSQASYAKLLSALEEANSITSKSAATKVASALNNLKSAYNNLSKVSSSSTEGKIARARADLRELVNGKAATAVKDKAKYTTSSYNNFSTALTKAQTILERTNTTKNEVDTAYSNLNTAINSLELLSNDSSHKKALEDLNSAISRAGTVKDSSYYTSTSYTKFKNALSKAQNIKNAAATSSVTDIEQATQNLLDAINALEPAIDSLKAQLNELIVECIDYEEDKEIYMSSSYKKFETALKEAREVSTSSTSIDEFKKAKEKLEAARDGLVEVSKVLKEIETIISDMKGANKMQAALSAAQAGKTCTEAQINSIFTGAKQDLDDLIDSATIDIDGESTSTELGTAFFAAKKVQGTYSSVYTYSKTALTEIAKAYSTLYNLINK